VSTFPASRFVTLCVSGLFALTSLAAQPPSAATPHHALWSLKGKTNTVYLLGSVHFLKPSDELPQAVDAAYRDAEKLMMEIDMDDLDPLATQQLTLDLGLLPDDRTLESEVGAETYRKVSAQARELNLDPALLNRFQPWLAAMTLVQLQLMRQGLNPDSGVEQRLTTRAVDDGKENARHAKLTSLSQHGMSAIPRRWPGCWQKGSTSIRTSTGRSRSIGTANGFPASNRCSAPATTT
jgi:uncharacterized protein YbaP (TraB family)